MTPGKQIRVVQVISASDIGGGQRHLLTLLDWFREDSGFSFRVVCRPGGVLSDRVAALGVPAEPMDLGDFLDLGSLYRLYRMFKTGDVDLVHGHLNRGCLLAAVAARLAGVPVVCTAHGMNRPLYYRFADRVIAVSEAVKRHLAGGLPAMEPRIRVIHNGIPVHPKVDARAVARFRNQHYIKPNEMIAGVLGTLHENKGQDVALRAMAKVPASLPLRLVIVGDGPAGPNLQRLASLLSLGTRVVFLPTTDEVNEFLTVCDFVLIPSLQEAFSLVAAEALLLRRPVIASETGGLPEVVRHGITGILFPPGDADRLAAILTDGVANYRQMERLAAEGPAVVLSHFSHNRMGNETRALYRELLAERAGPPRATRPR